MKSNLPPDELTSECAPWLEWLTAQGRSPVTVADYRFGLRQFFTLLAGSGVATLREVTRDHVELWLRAMMKANLQMTTIQGYFRPVQGLFGWLERRGDIFLSPIRNLEIPSRPRRLLNVPSEAQMLRLLESVAGDAPVDLRDRAIIEVAYATGFRCRELVALDLDSIDLTARVVRVTGKGEKERKGLLTNAAVSALKRYLSDGRPQLVGNRFEESALWIGSKKANRLGKIILRKAVKDRAAMVRLKITPHDIRRAFATHMLSRGASPFDLRRFLGHSSCQHLQHYLRYAPEELRAAHRKSALGQ